MQMPRKHLENSMQGSQSSATTLPGIVNFDNDSTSSESGIESTLPWNTVPIPAQNPLLYSGTHQEDNDDCRVIGSSNGGIAIDGSEDRFGSSSFDGQSVSRKRKTLEVQSGPSSGSSIFIQNTEKRHCHIIPENNTITNNGPEQANNELRLGVGEYFFSPSLLSSTASVNNEVSHRNLHLHQQDSILPENLFSSDPADVRNMGFSSFSHHISREALRNSLLELNPPPVVENRSLQRHSSLLEAPTVDQSRWSGSSSARSTRSSAALYEESTHRTIPRRLSEHPMLVPTGDTGNSSRTHTNWNFSGVGGNNTNNIDNSPTAGNAASAARVGSTRGESLSAFDGSHRSLPQYQSRLSEIVRRSLLLSERGVGNNHVGRSQETASAARLDSNNNINNNVGRHVPILRSGLLERHLDDGGAFRVPYSWRSFSAASSEGRSSTVMSERIRHVLDLMRRGGEGLRFEDAMVLLHSHDRHRDMRLDVDSMSYEELLALEERIGNVCTGLSEETVLNRLKQRKFVDCKVGCRDEIEPCSICREEYNNGEDLGTLECGHDFHKDCISRWLVQKNLCPICKTTGLNNA